MAIIEAVNFILERHGVDVTITKDSSFSYDPSTGTASSSQQVASTKGYFYNEKTLQNTPTPILGDSNMVIISADGLSFEPGVGDIFSSSVGNFVIEQVSGIKYAGQDSAYILKVRTH